MNSVIEPIRKCYSFIDFGWNPEEGANPQYYTVYVGTAPTTTSMQVLSATVSPTPMKTASTALGKVYFKAEIATVQSVLGLPVTTDFSNVLLYFALTYTENSIASSYSPIIEVPPVGIIPSLLKDDPTKHRHPHVFSDELQRWHKQAGSSRGAMVVDGPIYYKLNEIQEYTYDSSGSVTTIKAYLTDATSSGCYAKLMTYVYSNGAFPTKPTKITIADSTV